MTAYGAVLNPEARSLLSMARLNIARPRVLCLISSRARMAHTSFGRKGRYCPIRQPPYSTAHATDRFST
jgi:hypothetical protein